MGYSNDVFCSLSLPFLNNNIASLLSVTLSSANRIPIERHLLFSQRPLYTSAMSAVIVWWPRTPTPINTSIQLAHAYTVPPTNTRCTPRQNLPKNTTKPKHQFL